MIISIGDTYFQEGKEGLEELKNIISILLNSKEKNSSTIESTRRNDDREDEVN